MELQFGKRNIGTLLSVLFPTADNKATCLFVLQYAASVTKLTVYLDDALGANDGGIRGLIYASDGTDPTTLLGTTDEVIHTDDGIENWLDLPFSTPITLAAGGYFIGVHSAGNKTGRYEVEGNNKNSADAYADGAANPFGTPTSSANQKSIYATYNPLELPRTPYTRSTVASARPIVTRNTIGSARPVLFP